METFFLMGLTVFLINLFPAFMPPTWIVLVFFSVQNGMNPVLTVVVGAIMAMMGRVGLMLLAQKFGKVLPSWMQNNYKGLGGILGAHMALTIPIVLAIAFSPIPSNQLFIIAGLSNLNKKLLAMSFFAGRILSYSFWVATANEISTRLEDIFGTYLLPKQIIFGGMGILLFVWIIGAIPWADVYRIKSVSTRKVKRK